MDKLPNLKIKREHTPYVMSIAVIVLDLAIIMLMSLIAVSFDFSTLKQSSFWASYISTVILTLIAYFGCIGAGKKRASDRTDYTDKVKTLNDKRDFIAINFLDDRRDAYIDAKNRVEKIKAHINLIDYRLIRAKKDDKRAAYKQLKAAATAALKLATEEIDNLAAISDSERERCRKLVSDADYNIDSIKGIPYRKIDKRVIKTGLSVNIGNNVGYYNESAILMRDSLTKIMWSLIITAFFAAIIPGEQAYTAGVIYQVVWRVLMVVVNAYAGLSEGYKLISEYKTAALSEQIDIHNQFLNYCLSFGIIAAVKTEK